MPETCAGLGVLPAGDAAMAAGLLAGDLRSLAKAISLTESRRPDHRLRAQAMVDALLGHTGKALRVGISGVPGVGKSSFIETLGLHLLAAGHRVAVLALDPSSLLTGGSILGDKTRMEQLSRQDGAFIRPSPAGGALGGLAAHSREALLLCEAAGYDIVLVETVGVGQSEATVASMTDVLVLLQLPNAGDELQALKKGVLEVADIVVCNKADLDAGAAALASEQLRAALHLVRPRSPHWTPPVLQCSARADTGILEVWQAVCRYRDTMRAAGEFDQRRRLQALAWMWQTIEHGLRRCFDADPAVQDALPPLLDQVAHGGMAPVAAANRLLQRFQRR